MQDDTLSIGDYASTSPSSVTRLSETISDESTGTFMVQRDVQSHTAGAASSPTGEFAQVLCDMV